MTTRAFNYTGRKLIPSDCIHATLNGDNSSPPELELIFDLNSVDSLIDLPNDAEIFVDLSYRYSYMRFCWGVIEKPNPPDDLKLYELDSNSIASLHIRVVKDGNLLAQSNKLTLTTNQNTNTGNKNLIDLVYRDLGETPWLLEISQTETIPILVINEKWAQKLLSSGFKFEDDPVALNLIMPQVLRGVLTSILSETNDAGSVYYDDTSTWKGDWIRYARILNKEDLPESDEIETNLSVEMNRWIDKTVDLYCKEKKITTSLVEFMKGGIV